jgi:hypothetical protein
MEAAEQGGDMGALCELDPSVGTVIKTLSALSQDPEHHKQTLWAALSLYYASDEVFADLRSKHSTIRVQPCGRT